MKWLVLLTAAVVLNGCCNCDKKSVEVVRVAPIVLNEETLIAASFCQGKKKSFKSYVVYDWSNIGKGYEYDIICEDIQK